ncbi:PAS domain-containing sensor histidine kinase [Azospirillum picis]|uniref:histidine kinase n=1 Tax=Azospirillum picis TaxID=488438 RepID=A0ABU0MM80_9PROT|nr:ATP-binding protein [Azospirillum picis]MBP2301062.1 two-component system sensor histidine kinase HupT/HoxJ [Azospirillum picis]MDQ0534318.1 two-component system sensor histidine kinase HupT/HoxJ [Azospirillum picis]
MTVPLSQPFSIPGMLPDADAESAWIEVIRKMDETYANLVAQQVELERKNAELEEAQAFIASVLGSMTDVLIACDRDGRIEQTNRAAERALGCTGAELTGRPLRDFLASSSHAAFARLCAAALQREGGSDVELSLRCPTGPFPVAVNSTVRYDQRGHAIGLVLVGRPVGELRRAYRDLAAAHEGLKQTQQQLVHSEKMASLGRLVAGVAHELNNPISFVYGNAHAMRRYVDRLTAYLDAVHGGTADGDLTALRKELRIDRARADVGATLDGMLEGTERVRDIVAELRRFSSEQKHASERFDLTALLRSAVTWVAKAQMPDLVVAFDLPDALDIAGHPGHLHQVAMNLVQNAIDAMAGAAVKRLELHGREEAGRVVVTIRDTGHGIPGTILERVFDPFFTTKPVGKGTGLGLSISYQLVKDHGGSLSAGNHPDGGALFTLALPAAGHKEGAAR